MTMLRSPIAVSRRKSTVRIVKAFQMPTNKKNSWSDSGARVPNAEVRFALNTAASSGRCGELRFDNPAIVETFSKSSVFSVSNGTSP